MKKNRKYHSALLLFTCMTTLLSLNLIGCQRELTKEEVAETSYYKDLKNQVKELRAEKKELEIELEEATKTNPDDQRALTYLKKLKRDSLVKLELAPFDTPSDSIFLSEKAILNAASHLAKNADLTLTYTPEELKKKYKTKYIYTLYDEDNSVFEITVFEGNYIVFSDLPHKVYYCYNADLLGKTFLTSEEQVFETSLLSKVERSSAVLSDDGKKLFTAPSIKKFVTLLGKIPKEEMEENTQESESRSSTHIFYNQGNKITLTLYETQLSFSSEEETIWYRISFEDMENLKKIFD